MAYLERWQYPEMYDLQTVSLRESVELWPNRDGFKILQEIGACDEPDARTKLRKSTAADLHVGLTARTAGFCSPVGSRLP
jgi:hypothetical protein